MSVLPAGALIGTMAVMPAHAEPPEGWDVAHSEISASTITVGAADSGMMPDGNYRMFAVTNSTPDSRLVEIDIHEQTVVNSYVLDSSSGSWGVHVAPDGTVWAASQINGFLWELPFGAEEPIAHERPTADTSFLWEVDSDEEGNVYAGTYEGYADPATPGRLVKFGTDGEWEVYDAFRDDSHYVRATAVVGDKVYAGTGSSNGQLFEVDPETGDRVEIPLPDGIGECNFVYGLEGVGDNLLARLQRCENAPTSDEGYLLDLETREWSEWSIPVYPGSASQPDEDGTFYAASENIIQAVDPSTGEITPLSSSGTSGSKDVELFTDPVSGDRTVISVSLRGKIILHNLDEGDYSTFTPSGLTGDEGHTARTAAAFPDGQYHISLRRNGGLGTFTLAEDAWSYSQGVGQAQGMAEHDGKLYIGVYPTASIVEYDPSQPWNADNPKRLFRLSEEGQDRPYGIVSTGDKVAIGTVADYGKLTGALTFYDPATGEYEVHKPSEDRGIGAITYHDGIVYGGTIIYGGGGSTPVHTEGTAFAWDVEAEELLWETVPLPGETGIGAITVDDDGRLFAASVGKVVEIDPATGTPLQEQRLTDDESTSLSGAWHISDLSWNPVEQALYLSTRSEIVRVSPSTLDDITPVATSGELLRVGGDGMNYWMNGRVVHTGTLPALELTDVEAPAPAVDAEAGTITIPDVDGVQYLLGGEVLEPGDHDAQGDVRVVANPEEGFRISVDSERIFELDVTAEPMITVHSAGAKLVGDATNLWGNAAGLEGETIVAEALIAGEWTKVGTATVGENGSYVVPLTGEALEGAGTYELRARVAENAGASVVLEKLARTGFGASPVAAVGRTANVWGTAADGATVSTQVQLSDGRWSTSQVSETDDDGWFVLPLTYGASSAGDYDWRVVVQHENGLREVTRTFTQSRIGFPSATSAGSAPVGRTANVWGTVDTDEATSVWTEVQLAGDAWSRSQVVTSNESGGYVIPLTYGANSAREYQWRVVTQHPDLGRMVSEEFSFSRTA